MSTEAQTKVFAETEVTLSRLIDAPRERVFEAWTDARQLAEWWGPRNFTNPVCEADPRPGGSLYIVMRGPDGTDYPMSGAFREVVAPERLVLVEIAEDQDGSPLLEGNTTVTFAEKDGKTRLTVTTHAVARTALGAEMLKGMEQGWAQSLDRLEDAFAHKESMSMKAEPQKEHQWLQRLAGDWSFEGECVIGPGQPPMKSSGSLRVYCLGGLWTIGEGEGTCPDGSAVKSIITLGYDPAKGRFVGTFIASMMTHLWEYDGALDSSGKVLTLDTEGPSFAGDGTMIRYQDIVQIENDDHWILRTRLLDEKGNWQDFMTAHYRRKQRKAA